MNVMVQCNDQFELLGAVSCGSGGPVGFAYLLCPNLTANPYFLLPGWQQPCLSVHLLVRQTAWTLLAFSSHQCRTVAPWTVAEWAFA